MVTRRLNLLLCSAVLGTAGLGVAPSAARASEAQIALVIIDESGVAPVFSTTYADSARTAENLEVSLERDPDIEVTRRSFLSTTEEQSRVAAAPDPLRGRQWALDALGVERAWAIAGDGTGVRVAVVDTGIAPHPDLAGRVVAARDFVGLPGTRYHGTSVAGIIAAASNTRGTVGVAPGVSLIDARVCLDNSDIGCPSEAVASGIVWAVQQGADVVNLSLGGAYDGAVAAAVRYALAQDVVVVSAAGNTACSYLLYGFDQSQGPNGNCTSGVRSSTYPANFAGVIGVAAITQDLTRASYSSYGPGVDVGAPTDVLTTGYVQYGSFAGTSAAAPHVAGTAALMLATDPSLTNDEVRAILMSTTKKYPNRLQHSTWTECGPYDPSLGYWSSCTGLATHAVPERELGGTGMLDTASAVAAASGLSELLPAPSVTSAEQSVSVGVSPVPKAAIYEMVLDNTVVATTSTAGMLEFSGGLITNAEHTLTVRAIGTTGEFLGSTRPVLVSLTNPALPRPVVQSATYGTWPATTVRLASSVTDSAVTGLLLFDSTDKVVAGCAVYTNDVSIGCEGFRPASDAEWYTASFTGRTGTPGARSTSFQIRLTSSVTLQAPQAVIWATQEAYTVSITPVDGASRYRFTAGQGWADVGDQGELLANSGRPTTCVRTEKIECSVSTEPGAVYSVYVAAATNPDPAASVTSFYANRGYTVSEPATVSFSAPELQSVTPDSLRVTWNTQNPMPASQYLGFDVFSSDGHAMGASFDGASWYVDVPLARTSPAELEVTVVPFVWVQPYGRPWWRATGQVRTAAFAVAPIPPPTELLCHPESGEIICAFAAPDTASSGYLFEGELRRASGELVSRATTTATGPTLAFRGPITAGERYEASVRTVWSGPSQRVSSRTATFVQFDPPLAGPTPTSPDETTAVNPPGDAPTSGPKDPAGPETSLPGTDGEATPGVTELPSATHLKTSKARALPPARVKAASLACSVVVRWTQPSGLRPSRTDVSIDARVVTRLKSNRRAVTLSGLSPGRHVISVTNVLPGAVRKTTRVTVVVTDTARAAGTGYSSGSSASACPTRGSIRAK